MRFLQLWPLALLLLALAYLYAKRKELAGKRLSERLALLLRSCALLLALTALAGPQLLSQVDAHYVYFLVDLSDSTQARLSEPSLIERLNSWATPQPHTQYGLIVFGKQAFVEVPFTPTLDLQEIYTDVDPAGTDLAAAIELASATFPKGGTKTIVLFSDGRQTQGDVSEVLVRAAREGVQLFTVPLYLPTSEFAVQDLRAPREVAVGLPFTFQSLLYASKPTRARLLSYRDDTVITNQEVDLHAGLNFLEGSDELRQPGIYEYRVELIAPGDVLTPNNIYRALVEAVGDPRILVVEANNEAESPSPLERLLQSAGHAYARVSLSEFAATPGSLLPYRAVVLDDVPLRELNRRQSESLERYVRDLGGGLWLIQGRHAVEEFYDRQLERLLPVTYEGPQEVQRPALALVMLLDRSGSMGEAAGLRRKIDLLKEAALGAVEKLDPRNLIGIIAFDSKYDWIVPLDQARGRKSEIEEAIGSLTANGGTDIYQALRDAISRLQKVPARVKHILVFSDGKVTKENRDFERVFREIGESTISASSIAIGAQADLDFLWRIAEVGGGVKYEVKDAQDLPDITLQELVRLERARWIKGPVPVVPGPFAYELHNLDTSRIPPVNGYVLTFEKPTSQTSLQVRTGDLPADPLVSQWRYGLGKVAVLNTSLSPEGVGRWLDWDRLSALAAAILSQIYSESPLQPKELTVQTQVGDSALTVRVEAEREGRWLDLLHLEGLLSGLESEPQPLEFRQVEPGRYQAMVENLAEGVYLLSVGEKSLGQVKQAISVPYAAEYRRVGLDQELLMRMARETGGEYLDSAEDLATRLQGRTWIYRDLGQPMVLLALLFFLLDLVARKLPIPRS